MGPVDNPGGGGYIYDLGHGEKPPAGGYRMPLETALMVKYKNNYTFFLFVI